MEEIQNIPQKRIFFSDSSLTINPQYTKKLFTKLREYDKFIDCAGNVNILAKDEELLNRASQAGVQEWHIGFESISQNTINNVRKNSNKISEYASAVKKIKDHGMMILGLFMFGFDTDSSQVFTNTIEAIRKMDLDHVRFSIVTPYPGTQLYNLFEKENRILTKNWSYYDSDHVVITPKQITSQQLYNGTRQAINQFYSLPHFLRSTVNTGNLTISNYYLKCWRNFFTMMFYKSIKKYEPFTMDG
jgi:radical SAM superfamily enzyme YgiQ (UPF0313 family)